MSDAVSFKNIVYLPSQSADSCFDFWGSFAINVASGFVAANLLLWTSGSDAIARRLIHHRSMRKTER